MLWRLDLLCMSCRLSLCCSRALGRAIHWGGPTLLPSPSLALPVRGGLWGGGMGKDAGDLPALLGGCHPSNGASRGVPS